MGNYNRWIGLGNLTRDPEIRDAGEARVAKFGMAVNRDYPTKETLFIDVEAWNRQAETIVKYFRKGDPILVDGRLRLDQWEKNGQKHSKIVVVMDTFEFVAARRERTGDDERGGLTNRSRLGRPEDAGRTSRQERSGQTPAVRPERPYLEDDPAY